MRTEFDRESHTYRINGRQVPSVTEVLAPLNDFSRVDRETLEAAREFGQHVHEACDLSDRGELDWLELDPALRPYVEAWKRFLDESGAVVIASETPVYHDVLGYAGTPDRVLHMRNHVWIPDLKSTSAVPKTVGAQTAAYARAHKHMMGGPEPKRCCIQLTPDGRYSLHVRNDPADWSLFVSALNIFTWKAKNNVAA